MTAAALAFFARHEIRLGLREIFWWIRARRRNAAIAIALAVCVYASLHLIAGLVVRPIAGLATHAETGGYLLLTGAAAMSFLLLLSQAMESVTRVLYARGDVDLILSSPAPAPVVFGLRLVSIAMAGTVLPLVILGPFVNMLAVSGGARWLAAYGVLAAMGMLATTVAIAATLVLFDVIGARRTRAVAQVVAAIIGAAMVIALQIAAILGHVGASRFDLLRSQAAIDWAPSLGSPVWLPVRAATGDGPALILILVAAALLLALAVALASRSFAERVVAAAGVARTASVGSSSAFRIRGGGVGAVLRAKELALLARDPWLLSQSLMQVLYLLPPALMLWVSFGAHADPLPVIVPAIVMAAGQLAGGLAWLAISGEDAPDLIATAPVTPRFAFLVKIEAVMIGLAIPVVPLLVLLAWLSPTGAATAALFVAIAAAQSTLIQILFRTQSRRSAFRRRQTASRVSTITEALSSNCWAATAALAVLGSRLALAPAVVALLVLAVAWSLAPRR